MKINKLIVPKIGMRTFKTAISVTIGLYVAFLLNLNSPVFVTIASVTTMQPSFYETYKSVRLRVFTCLMGVILGTFLGYFVHNPLLSPIVAGLGIIFCISLLLNLNMSRMISLTVLVFIASFVSEVDKVEYGVDRIIGTIVGVLVSLLVNYFIAAPKVHINLTSILEETYEDVNKIARTLLIRRVYPDLTELQREIEEANSYYKLIKNEIQQPLAPDLPIHNVEEIIEVFNEVFILLRLLSSMPDSIPTFTHRNKDLIGDIFSYNVFEEGDLEGIPNIVTNFHIQTLLEKLKILKEFYRGGIADELK